MKRKVMARRTKKDAQRRHARIRALERYGIEMSHDLRDKILQSIQQGKSIPIRKQSIRVSVHDVTIEGHPTMRVVYDKQRKEIVTFLDPEWD